MLELSTEDGQFQELFILCLVLLSSWKYRFNQIQPLNPPIEKLDAYDDMISKQVRTEVPVDGQTISKYSFVRRTVDSAAARKSIFYH